MKIATYNVWNDDNNFEKRRKQLIQEITAINADIIALQEVTPGFFVEDLKSMEIYPHCEFGKYMGKEERLAILSKHPFMEHTFLYTEEYRKSNALNVLIQVGQLRFSFTNVHLPWDSAIAKEKHYRQHSTV